VRRRLLVTVMVLVAMVLVGLGVPLAVTAARSAQQALFVDRLADTVRFAALAQRPLVEAEVPTLLPEMRRYDEVYGIAVALLGRDGGVLAASRPGLDGLAAADRVRVALAGRRSESYPTLMPWDDAPMLLAEAVLVDGEVRGAAVTVSPTATLRHDVAAEWLLLLGAGLVALGLAALGALPVVRWILRPVRRLDAGLARVAAAVLSGGTAEPVGDSGGPPELRRLASSFDQMAATVTQALAAQRAFVADASHQLRNPLTALRLRLHNLDAVDTDANGTRPGGADVGDADIDGAGSGGAGSGGADRAGAAEERQAALEEADRLGEVLDGLLALARAERAPTELDTVELDRVLADRLEVWRVLAEHEGLRLRRGGRRGLAVRTQSGAVETVLDAVLDNAIKFSPPGGDVVVHTEAEGAEVLLSVRDHGPGMAPDELERATDRFWRSPSRHNVEGSGLGLAIAASTVVRCGGRLELELPGGGGLRVVTRLRSAPAPAPAGGRSAGAPQARPSGQS
jgi:signal transduction histidine kinase